MSGPLYQRIAADIRDRYASGEYRAGQSLPAERVLMERFSVSRVTIRRALKELVDAELLQARQGSGYRFTDSLEQPLNRITSFSEDCHARGIKPESRWLSCDESLPTLEECEHFGIEGDCPVLRVKRVRLGDGEPLALDEATLRLTEEIRPPWPDDSLYKALALTGDVPVDVHQAYQPVVADDALSDALQIEPGSALMLVTRKGRCIRGEPVEYARCWLRADRWQFSHHIRTRMV